MTVKGQKRNRARGSPEALPTLDRADFKVKGVPRVEGARLDDDANLGDVTARDVYVAVSGSLRPPQVWQCSGRTQHDPAYSQLPQDDSSQQRGAGQVSGGKASGDVWGRWA